MNRNSPIAIGLIYLGILLSIDSCTPAVLPVLQNPEAVNELTSLPILVVTGSSSSEIPSIVPEANLSETLTIMDTIATKTLPPNTPATTTPVTPSSTSYCSEKIVHLDIPDRDEDENAPEEGWCGETSIQMALEYYGKQVSQQAINLAGKPKQPDLWEDDIDVALDTLGVKYSAWDETNSDVDAFLSWIGEQLQAGYPLLLGVKIYPDENPDWEIDHFVLVVGCDRDSLIINTNNAGEGQVHATYEELTTDFVDSYSLINRQKYLFGRAIQGLR